MGCTSSLSFKKRSFKHFNAHPDPVNSHIIFTMKCPTELNPTDKQAVRQTWPTLAKDLHGNGLQLFLRIFELCPEVKALFYVENIRLSQLARNATIKSHGGRFINAIGKAVDSLDEFDQNDNKLCKFLFSLGQKHTRFPGFKPHYFEIFYEALMFQWERCMGDQFTPEVADAWSHLFVYLIEKLKDGYFSPGVQFETYLEKK